MSQERMTFFVEDHIAAYAKIEAERMGMPLLEYARLMFARGVLLSEIQETAQQIAERFHSQVKFALEQQVETFAAAVVERMEEIEHARNNGSAQ